MLLKFDTMLAEAKARVDNLCNKIEVKLKKTLKYFNNLIATLRKSEEKRDNKNCVWLCEMRYLSTANSLTELQQGFGMCVKNILGEAMYLECLRISCVKKAMQEYMQLQATIFIYQIDTTMEALGNIDEDSSESLQHSKLFRSEEIKTMQEIGITEDFIENLAIWSPESVSGFEWVLKEGNIFIENGVFQQWQDCYGVIVKSRFIHIFNSKPQFPFNEPLESLYLANARLMVSQNSDFFVEITENTHTGFFNKLVTGKQLVIKTKDFEDLMEWMELMQSLK